MFDILLSLMERLHLRWALLRHQVGRARFGRCGGAALPAAPCHRCAFLGRVDRAPDACGIPVRGSVGMDVGREIFFSKSGCEQGSSGKNEGGTYVYISGVSAQHGSVGLHIY